MRARIAAVGVASVLGVVFAPVAGGERPLAPVSPVGAHVRSPERPPLLSVLSPAPVVVTGARFAPRERVTVRVLVYGESQLGKVVLAGRRGGFSVSFPELTISGCKGYMVTAVGSKGSRARQRAFVAAPCGATPQP